MIGLLGRFARPLLCPGIHCVEACQRGACDQESGAAQPCNVRDRAQTGKALEQYGEESLEY
jgi:hypothetical protein